MPAVNTQETCHYCQGNCPNEPEDSEYLCDGFAGDIDGLYASSALKLTEGDTDYELDKFQDEHKANMGCFGSGIADI
jgi:hypothetical protein